MVNTSVSLFQYERFCCEWSSRGNTVRETDTTLLFDGSVPGKNLKLWDFDPNQE
ncbi:hypothetical protein DPX16_11514 [Anabarilius grahami]|uniref:Uncharacterized protein n=1 Tax=Anabarilius grahami TaxID=495550 RepID=A0A3N0YHU5_ANAGA|nr:hypothetical protein DPX16_11514 [Anabarilius grahami]